MSAPALAVRFAAAADREPLSALSPAARAELDAELARAGTLDDLPGKWQAALLAAELGRDGGHACCGGL